MRLIEHSLSIIIDQPMAWFCVPLAIFTAFLMGFARSAFAAGGFVVSPLMVLALGARNGLAVVAPLMLFAGAFSCYQHREGLKSDLLKPLLWGALWGTIIGGIVLWLLIVSGQSGEIHRRLEFVVGGLSLIYVLLIAFRSLIVPKEAHKIEPWKVTVAGSAVSTSQVIANSGTPIITIFFLFHRIKKEVFVDVQAWFLEAQNLLKLIPFIWLGLLHFGNFGASVILLPLVILGNWFGLFVFKRFDERAFFRLFLVLLVVGLITSCILLYGRGSFFGLFGYYYKPVW